MIKKTRKIMSLLSLVCILLPNSGKAQKNIYENPDFSNISKAHERIAILPFKATVNLGQSITKEAQQELEASEGIAVQNALETYFLKAQKRKRYKVSFQNTKDTNAYLNKKGISYDNLDIYTTSELCDVLKVDAIISGSINLNVQLSKGRSKEFKLIDYVTGNTKYGRIGIKVSDATTGKLIWKYEKEIDRKTGKNTQELIESMMRQASRKFPYELESLP